MLIFCILHFQQYLAELCLLEADPYLQFKPSIIAASALATARHCLLCERCTGEDKDRRESRDSKEGRETTEIGVLATCAAVAWPAALVTCSGYTLADLELCLRELARTHSHASLQPYQAVPDKYKSNK